MSYISISDRDKRDMLAAVGVGAVEELFGSVPEWTRVKGKLDLPGPMSELELARTVGGLADRNSTGRYLSFLGGGAYEHYIPAVVDQLSSRGEYVTPYTPYQPEVSQGTLQVTFEFQTLICQLTGLDIANASLYDGSTGAAEAALMAHRVQGKTRLLVSKALHPQYREVIKTYFRNLGITLVEVPYGPDGRTDIGAAGKLIDTETAAVLVQSPNYFGVVEDLAAFSSLAHGKQALSVAVVAEAVSLGLLEAPGRLGADIVTGEGQSFGIPLSYGGPYLGFLATKKDYVRQMPGRVAGMTRDVDGRRGFVLTLATREQHIRREKATSNICSNQALCAVRATIFLETLGRHGLTELARQNAAKAAYAEKVLTSVPGVKKRFSRPFFNEFVLELPLPWTEVEGRLRGKGILGGLALGRDYPELAACALVSVTEMRTREEIDGFGRALREVLS